ncbi:MAG: hypothetical protein LUD17_08540 [Bacteroidales bacterium]|nr:hypothetical protein [Bacteroidales bacterium]
MKNILIILSVLLCAVGLSSCHSIDDDRIPPATVYVPFSTIGDWNVYGVAGAGSYRYFIKSQKKPSGYPYTALSGTGFGGVLLVGDVFGNPVAYDMCCPVECRSDTRIRVIESELIAECPTCHSTYDVFTTNYGYPLSGTAAERGYGLKRYYVISGSNGEYMVITR